MSRSIRPERLFIDTWGWLALADARDPAHAQAVSELRSYAAAGALITSDYVLDETITRLFSACPFPAARQFSDAIFQAASSGSLQIERITPERFEAAYRLRLRYRDKPRISFTDLTSFVLMHELAIRNVLTADRHFAQVHLGFRCLP